MASSAISHQISDGGSVAAAKAAICLAADAGLYYKSYIDYTRGDYAKARTGFERLMRSEVYRAVAPFYLLQLEFRQRNYAYVLDHGDALIRTASPRQQRDLLRMMAEAHFHTENYEKALDYVKAYRQAEGEEGARSPTSRGSRSIGWPAATRPPRRCDASAERTTP